MTDNVVDLKPAVVGSDYRVSIDAVIQSAKDAELADIVIIGAKPDGALHVGSSGGDVMMLIEAAKLRILGVI